MSAVLTKDFVLDKFTAVDFLLGDTSRRILLNDVSWAEYERFLEDFEARPGWRLAFDGGKLEIMPSTPEHEEYSFSFHDFVRAYCDRFDINLEGRRSATFRSKILRKGVEPDECYYVQNAEKIAGKKIPNDKFPVPDIAVEVDITTESLDKFPIYAALEVPELWIYDGKILSFYKLDGGKYHQITKSRALGKLSAKDLTKFLEISRKKGQTAALKSFRVWLGKITK
jgi:Uma2 family endonuclease